MRGRPYDRIGLAGEFAWPAAGVLALVAAGIFVIQNPFPLQLWGLKAEKSAWHGLRNFDKAYGVIAMRARP